MMTAPSLEDLEQRETMLVFSRFSEDTAWEIGTALVATARRATAPVVVDIRTPDRTLFHAALPGSAPDNDHWARRKRATSRCVCINPRCGRADDLRPRLRASAPIWVSTR
jgi:uncharacterized protein (UPF0303 family)